METSPLCAFLLYIAVKTNNTIHGNEGDVVMVFCDSKTPTPQAQITDIHIRSTHWYFFTGIYILTSNGGFRIRTQMTKYGNSLAGFSPGA